MLRPRNLAAGAAAALAALWGSGVDAEAVVNSAVDGTGKLTVTTDGQAVTIACDTGNVEVNGANPTGGPFTCSSITAISVAGSAAPDNIDLSGVTTGAGFSGLDGNVTVTGGDGFNDITGGGFDDRLTGGELEDLIAGGAGDDTITAGGDDNTLTGGLGSDSIVGGLETDALIASGSSATLTDTSLAIGGDTDTLALIDRVSIDGTGGPDSLVASAFNDAVALTGFGGSDTLIGAQGNDFIRGGGGPADGADIVAGNGGNDVIGGSAGNDTLSGGADDDRFEETVIGASALTDTSFNGSTGTDSLAGIERASITGDTGSDTIDASGFTGEARLSGQGGNDILTGGSGPDGLFGNAGVDTLLGNGGTDTLGGGTESDSLDGGGAEADLLSEGQLGSSTLTDTQFQNGTGTDVLADIDAASLSASSTATLDASAFTLGPVSLIGSAGADSLIGGTQGDRLFGNIGNDTLSGAAGDDSLAGVGGNDRAFGGPGADTLTDSSGSDSLDGGTQADRLREEVVSDATLGATLFSSDGTDTLAGFESAEIVDRSPATPLTLDASAFVAGPVTLLGGGGDDRLVPGGVGGAADGEDGDDVLVYGPADHLLIGGAGDDELEAVNSADFELADSGVGEATLHSAGDDDTLQGIERARLRSTAASSLIDASGFSGRTELEGADGNDTLLGGSAADTLTGNGGDDSIKARDGVADRVDCGDGPADFAEADLVDERLACESVSLPPGDGGPGQQPGPPAGLADRTAPVVGIRGKITVTPKGVLQFVLTCPAGESVCQGTAELTTTQSLAARSRKRRATRLGRKGFKVAGGRRATLRLKLSKAGFASLKRRKTLKVALTVKVSDAALNSAVKRKALTLRAPARRRKT